jgi:hypothetical protein
LKTLFQEEKEIGKSSDRNRGYGVGSAKRDRSCDTYFRVIYCGRRCGVVNMRTGKDLRDKDGGKAVTKFVLRKEYRGLSQLRDMFASSIGIT